MSLLEEIRHELCHGCFSLNFLKSFRTAMSKSNHIFMKWVLSKKRMGYSDLISSAVILVIHNICKFKTFYLLLRCLIWSSNTKNIQNCIIVIFHLCLANPSFKPVDYNVGWHLLFHNWCKTIKWLWLREIKDVICISTKLAFNPALLWGWKISNIKTILYVLQARAQKR